MWYTKSWLQSNLMMHVDNCWKDYSKQVMFSSTIKQNDDSLSNFIGGIFLHLRHLFSIQICRTDNVLLVDWLDFRDFRFFFFSLHISIINSSLLF